MEDDGEEGEIKGDHVCIFLLRFFFLFISLKKTSLFMLRIYCSNSIDLKINNDNTKCKFEKLMSLIFLIENELNKFFWIFLLR